MGLQFGFAWCLSFAASLPLHRRRNFDKLLPYHGSDDKENARQSKTPRAIEQGYRYIVSPMSYQILTALLQGQQIREGEYKSQPLSSIAFFESSSLSSRIFRPSPC